MQVEFYTIQNKATNILNDSYNFFSIITLISFFSVMNLTCMQL